MRVVARKQTFVQLQACSNLGERLLKSTQRAEATGDVDQPECDVRIIIDGMEPLQHVQRHFESLQSVAVLAAPLQTTGQVVETDREIAMVAGVKLLENAVAGFDFRKGIFKFALC